MKHQIKAKQSIYFISMQNFHRQDHSLHHQSFSHLLQHRCVESASLLPRISTHHQSSFSIDMLEKQLSIVNRREKEEYIIKKMQKERREKEQADKIKRVKQIQEREQYLRRRHIRRLRMKLNEMEEEVQLEHKKLARMKAFRYNRQEHQMSDIACQVNSEPISRVIISNKRSTNSKTLRKFRIAALAALFSVAFPRYSRGIRLRRKQQFFKMLQDGALNKEIKQIYNHLAIVSQPGLPSHPSSSGSSKKSYPSYSSSSFSGSSAPSSEGSYQSAAEVGMAGRAMVYLDELLDKVRLNIKNGSWDGLLQILCEIVINGAFMADSLLLPNQMYRLEITTQEGGLFLDKQHEKQLLSALIFAKILGYGFLLQGSAAPHPYFHLQNKKFNSSTSILDLAPASYKTKPQKLKAVSGAILCQMHNSTIDNKIDRQKCRRGNLETMKSQNVSMPMKELEVLYDKEVSRQTISVEVQEEKLKIEQYGVVIHGISGLASVVRKALKLPFYDQVQQKMKELVNICHEKCVNFRRQKTKRLKTLVVSSIPPLLEPRNSQQAQYIANLMTTFKQKREFLQRSTCQIVFDKTSSAYRTVSKNDLSSKSSTNTDDLWSKSSGKESGSVSQKSSSGSQNSSKPLKVSSDGDSNSYASSVATPSSNSTSSVSKQ